MFSMSSRPLSFAVLLSISVPASAFAQGTLFVENDRVGVGVETPSSTLHVQKDDGSTRVLVQETNATVQVRELFRLGNNGGPFFIFSDNSTAQSYSFAMAANGDFIISQQQHAGVEFRLTPSGELTIGGSLHQGSSREIKRDIVPVDAGDVLRQVDELPIATWSYSADRAGNRHLGPMAEDFHQTFGLGTDPRTISTIDTSGVALAAIQGLHELVREQASLIEALQQRVEQLETRTVSGDAMALPASPE